MTTEKKADQQASPNDSGTNHTSKPNPPTKIAETLNMILASGTRGVHRFEAERNGDHCLPSTISSLKKRGVVLADELIKVPGRHGNPTYVKRYWVEPEHVEQARTVLRCLVRRAA